MKKKLFKNLITAGIFVLALCGAVFYCVMRAFCTESEAAAALPTILWTATLVLIATIAVSALLTLHLSKEMTRLLSSIDPARPDSGGVYEELTPLVKKFREQDRTIRRQMEELGRQQREFSAIADNMSECFLLLDSRLKILSGNQRALELLPNAEAGGSLRNSQCPDAILSAVEGALSGERTERIMNEELRSFHVIANPVSVDGQITGCVVIIMDITEREQREALRREFSANVSHELKTPLTSICGFAELMKDGLVPPEKMSEFSGDIYKESMRLIDLVDDIIKLSRLDEDTPEFERESVDLYAVCEEVVESLSPIAEKRDISLEISGVHAKISGVWQILSEMVYNLCDNAIKYNVDGGSVKLSVAASGSEVRLTVEDTGIGIPASHQGRVFERFYRVDKSHSKEIGGTGLGLSIVKHGASYHNARIQLESEQNKGTKITLIF